MAKYDSRRHGAASREKADVQMLRDAWATADTMNAGLPEGTSWRWVPKTTIFVDESILPRDGGTDPKLVQHYADIWHDLPPIVVQKGTFKLLDGAHRYGAAFETQAGTDHVKIVEEELADEDLKDRAFELNVTHGRPLTLKERMAYAKDYIERHPNAPVTEIAKRAGVARATVSRLKDGMESPSEVVTYQRGEQTVTRAATVRREPRPATVSQPAPVRHVPDPVEMPTEPAALTGIRAIASIRNTAAWMEANGQFADEIREYLPTARKVLAEMVDILAPEPAGIV